MTIAVVITLKMEFYVIIKIQNIHAELLQK